jgi:hypothetical protein
LIGNDAVANVNGGGGYDMSINGSAVRFGGAQSQPNQEWNASQSFAPDVPGGNVLLRWHGSSAYGDPSSNAAVLCADSTLAYRTTWGVTTAMNCQADAKQAQEVSYDHFIFEQDYDTTSIAENIARSVHYPQNGCTTCGEPPDQSDVNGSTSCINSLNLKESCANFPTDLRIESIESNVGTATFGVISQLYPVTSGIVGSWDCPGTYSDGVQPQCSPSSTYSGGLGASNRVSMTLSSGTSFETLIVHHIMRSLTDTTFSSKQLVAAGWTGAEACGSLSCAVYFAYRGIGTAAVPSFTTCLSSGLPHQYILTGVEVGTYNVTIGGNAVVRGYSVAPGDNTIEFLTTSGATGTVSLSLTSTNWRTK